MGLREDVDARLTTLWPHIVARQEAFFAAHGRYFQGLRTHATIPANGDETPPDLTTNPHDQPETWAGAGYAFGATLPMRIAVDTYAGPLGAGWVARVWVRAAAVVWTRARGVGPHAAEYTTGWERA